MKKRLIPLLLLLGLILGIYNYTTPSHDSDFQITFIDVGQGDSALIQCDGQFMLIDGGDTDAADAVARVLQKNRVTQLDYLVASHMHEDHIGGFVGGLNNITKIGRTLSNTKSWDTKVFEKFNHRIQELGSQIEVPKNGATYQLGSAEVTVVDVSAKEDNDSLVLLITYGKTTFLFTGDIEKAAHSRVAEALRSPIIASKLSSGVNLIKMPHHGAYNSDRFLPDNAWDNSLYTLIDASWANYFVISVGESNKYGHPHENTLKIINNLLQVHDLDPAEHLFRTDRCGDIVVTSDGTKLDISAQK